jgi:myo-inositol-1(or 4)-monophosphatase
MNLKEEVKTAKKAALNAGKYLVENFCKSYELKFKTPKDITIAEDKESERIIFSIIKAKYPSYNIFSEETGIINKNSEYTWVVDPLDGTNNYIAGIPYFAVSIALLKAEEIILGVVYNPASNQLFEATKNEGAFLNGMPMQPSKNKVLEKSLCSFIQGHTVSQSQNLSDSVKTICNKISTKCRRVITTWAPSLDWCLLAYGGIDLLISFESETEDMYAGLLIAKEAGAKIIDFNGKSHMTKSTKIIAGNNSIIEKMLNIIGE